MRDEEDLHLNTTHSCSDTTSDRSASGSQVRKLPFLIKRNGEWLYKGEPLNRKAMVCLFGSVLTRDSEGAYLLRTPVETGYIDVEDAPFQAVKLEWSGCGRMQKLCFCTNTDEPVVADREHPIRTRWQISSDFCAEGACPPYLTVRAGDGLFPVEARLSRSVWYELAALAEPGQCHGIPCMGVWSCDSFFPLSLMPPEEPEA